MKPKEGSSHSGDPIELARLLATVAAGDTLMRDLYPGRARSLLAPTCSAARYRSAVEDRTAVDRLLAQSRAVGHLLALVGGDTRYGGIADLCGISSSDARENTVVRFAVVRRERLATGLV